MADCNLETADIFLIISTSFFIKPYRQISSQQGRCFNIRLFYRLGYFILILMNCIKCPYRLGSSQNLPGTITTWEGKRNFIILRRICRFKRSKAGIIPICLSYFDSSCRKHPTLPIFYHTY